MNISLTNVWLFYVIGYGILWLAMILENKKRGVPVEGKKFYEHSGKKVAYIFGYVQMIAILAVTLFIPLGSGWPMWMGFAMIIIGVAINCAAIIEFLRSPGGLLEKGIYRFSRNPMYVGGLIFMIGLNFIGLHAKPANYLFVIITMFWITITNWNVKQEKAFLEKKYTKAFIRYKSSVSKYIGRISNHK